MKGVLNAPIGNVQQGSSPPSLSERTLWVEKNCQEGRGIPCSGRWGRAGRWEDGHRVHRARKKLFRRL